MKVVIFFFVKMLKKLHHQKKSDCNTKSEDWLKEPFRLGLGDSLILDFSKASAKVISLYVFLLIL